MIFQSTRPRGARRHRGNFHEYRQLISIHAPTRGATDDGQGRGNTIFISIHAPTRGATITPAFRRRPLLYFNPRAHAGRDIGQVAGFAKNSHFNPRAHAGRDFTGVDYRGRDIVISIHAPTRGATGFSRARPDRTSDFNPRAHAGRDVWQNRPGRIHYQFQSTRPRGARLQDQCRCVGWIIISIHAPTRGATSARSASIVVVSFQSTRPRGARRLAKFAG